MQMITFSRVGDLEIKFDLDVPADITGALPAFICIHGGGIIAGSRNEPGSARLTDFIREFALSRGFLFISTDYRLIWPSTGLDIIDDVKTLFTFLADPSFSETYLPSAGIYADPKPIVSIIGAGGAILTDFG
ncbi:hypothetical protein EVJ58_g10108 [Rhodofomes roseus]|uniref:BD-FAE-like domain-containing protein n=1 Tax=Rhodofomes roseus TaxID=34475 RepID=A0A4Y9XQ69_9APHY|nr:hypothetical protein EVJ58_g10108 [Rhodofomes roseus]